MDPLEFLVPGNQIYVKYSDNKYVHGVIKYVNHNRQIEGDSYTNCTILKNNNELINHNLYRSDYENENGILPWKYDTITSIALKKNTIMEYEIEELDEDADKDADAEDADEDEDEDEEDAEDEEEEDEDEEKDEEDEEEEDEEEDEEEEDEEDEEAEDEEEDEEEEDENEEYCGEGHNGCIIIRERDDHPLIVFSTAAMYFSITVFFSLCVYRLANIEI